MFIYKTKGVCSTRIFIELENDIIKNVEFENGCNGNLKGISKLVKGQEINDIIDRLEGISCEGKQTSCPDQLSEALKSIKFHNRKAI